jgi:hypothetical protein
MIVAGVPLAPYFDATSSARCICPSPSIINSFDNGDSLLFFFQLC